MKYKQMALYVLLLIGTPAFGQETSPIVIKTGQPTPSVVRTGEMFKVTYQAQFYDEVLIIEEQMRPDNIIAEPFEVVDLEVISLPDRGDDSVGIIHTKDFIYTFRIIKPEKGDKTIPQFNFIWVIKKAGVTEANAKEGNELKEIATEEVGVRYVYSPIKPPPLNIRDEIDLPLFKWSGRTLRNYGYIAITSSFLLSLTVVVLLLRLGNTKKEEISEKNVNEGVADAMAEVVPSALPKKARKKFLRELTKILGAKDIDVPSLEIENKVYSLLRELILVELSGNPVKASVSDTPGELNNRLRILGAKDREAMGLKYGVYIGLTGKLKNYYEDMESGQLAHFIDPRLEVQSLLNIVEMKSLRKRFREFISDFWGMISVR